MTEMIGLTFFFQLLKGRYYGNQFWDRIGEIRLTHVAHSSHWHSQTDWSIARNDVSGRHFVSFRAVTPEFTRLECVQQASVCTPGLFHCYSLRGATARPDRLQVRSAMGL